MLRPVFTICLILAIQVRCGSLIGEADRVKQVYNYKNSTAPQVLSTDPADGTTGPYNQTYIDVTFSTEVDAATVTVQSVFGSCSGSLQISYDGFSNCLAGTIDAAANPRIRFIPTVFPKGLGLQLRASVAITNVYGKPIEPYTSPLGFKLGAPCGAQNCFFSYSTPLMSNAGTATGIFLIRSGSESGRYLIYSSGNPPTATIIDPVAVTSKAGPVFSGLPVTGAGMTDFYISGGTHIGKQVIIGGGNGSSWFIYDPASNSVASQSALPMTVGAGASVVRLQNSSDVLIIAGNNSTGVMRYNAATGIIVDAGINASATVAQGGHSVYLENGMNSGKWLAVHGGTLSSTSLLNETGPAITLSTAVAASVVGGAQSFEVKTGVHSGKLLTILGGGTGGSLLDLTTFAAATALNTLTPHVIGDGSLLLRQSGTASENAPLLITGNGFTSSRYDATAGNFVQGPTTTGFITSGSSAAYIPSASGGAFLIANGTAMVSTSVYFPTSNLFSGTRMPMNVPNQGANSFVINGGAQNGRTLVVAGALSRETAVFDPLRFEMVRGPQLTGNASAGAFNLPLPGLNRVLVFFGNSTTYNIYDPSMHSFSATGGPSLGAATAAGAVAFSLYNSAASATGKFVVMLGGGPIGQMFDEANLSGAASAVNSPCSVSSAPFQLRYRNSTNGEYRQLVFCSGNSMALFNHNTGAFAGMLTLSAGAGTGIQGFVINGGANNGRVLIIHGGGATDTTLIDTATDTVVGAGPSVSPACSAAPNTGAQVLPITSGSSNGRVVLLPAGGSSASCIYDPVGHSFSAGNSVGPGVGFQLTSGALAFRTNGGLYPTSFIILSGSNKNVWSAYVP